MVLYLRTTDKGKIGSLICCKPSCEKLKLSRLVNPEARKVFNFYLVFYNGTKRTFGTMHDLFNYNALLTLSYFLIPHFKAFYKLVKANNISKVCFYLFFPPSLVYNYSQLSSITRLILNHVIQLGEFLGITPVVIPIHFALGSGFFSGKSST